MKIATLVIAGVLAQAAVRPSIDVVQVPVSVRTANRPLPGLTAADFVVTDNAVRQQIDLVTVESTRVDVTLVVDSSAATGGADKLTRDLQQIAQLVRPPDTFQLVRIDASIHEALIAALVRQTPPDRRQLIIAMTDARDTMSFSAADRVRDVASRSDAILQIVTVRAPATYRPRLAIVRLPYNDQDVLILTEAAESTGGELRSGAFLGDADRVTAFRNVFDEFRQSYLLRYTPRDVELGGWHELSVTVPRFPNVIVRARKGYPGS